MAAICAVSSLPALITSLLRAHREKGALSILLAACCTLLTATYISAVFHADAFNSVLYLWPDAAHLTTYIPLIGVALTLCCIAGFIAICIHYAMPMDEAFDLCYQELVGLTQKWHISYNNVNYLLFILPFILFTAGNIYLTRLIEKRG